MHHEQGAPPTVRIYYDGLCPPCSREILHYRKMNGADKIGFVDITSPEFNAESEDLDPLKVHQVIHAKDAEGKVYLGVDAFILIWSQLKSLRWLAGWAQKKPIYEGLKLGYMGFAKVRPLLPRKKCQDSPFCET